MTENLTIENLAFTGTRLATAHGSILLIQGTLANLGCGYFSPGPAEKLQDRFAIVKGVKCFEDMLNAVVCDASPAAVNCGVKPGSTTGKEALLLMEKTPAEN